MLYLLPYKIESNSAKALAATMGITRIKPSPSSRWKDKEDRVVINWGCSSVPDNVANANIVNKPEQVAIAGNKLLAFDHLQQAGFGTLIPPYTDSIEVAKEWIENGKEVVCRTVLKGHSGQGIVLASKEEDLVAAPLYTEYLKKKEEFRLHVINGDVVDITRKARKLTVEEEAVNWKVRNLAGGFVYVRGEGMPSNYRVYNIATDVINALGLDFGAVDIIWNQKKDIFTVLEVNCAPGLEGQTLNTYANHLLYFNRRATSIPKKRMVAAPVISPFRAETPVAYETFRPVRWESINSNPAPEGDIPPTVEETTPLRERLQQMMRGTFNAEIQRRIDRVEEEN